MRVVPFVVASLVAGVAAAAFPAGEALGQEAPAAAARPAWDFPKDIEAGGVRLALHEPAVLQHDAEAGTTLLRFPVAATDPVGRSAWGIVEATGNVHLDLSSRLVLVDGMAVAKTVLPGLDSALATAAAEKLPERLPAELLLRLELFTDRPGAAPTEESPHGKISTRPPEIHVRRTPAVLVQLDGEPVTQPIERTPLEYVVNSGTDIFHETRDDRWLMLVDGFWASAPKIDGPWAWYDDKLPVVMTQLSIEHPRGHVRRFVEGTRRFARRAGEAAPQRPAEIPEIIVARKPAELVLLEGDPLFTLVARVKLMTVANTESDLFFHPRTAKYFLLISGRWFEADEVDGPWSEHYGAMPEEFGQIPRDHGRAHVLWSVAGTPEANEARARALLPERVLLHRRIQAGIKYEGPKAETSPMEGTEARRVRNSEDEVFEASGAWWACVRGAWFTSQDGRSSWKPVESLPAPLQAIPESTGAWHVNVCRPLGSEEKGVRFVVRGPYRGVYLYKGVPVHGNGWDTNGLLRGGNWYPMPRTYGENRWYDPLAGEFRSRTVRIGPDGRAAADDWSPYTASYSRIRWYADRYLQGGRRMFTYDADKDAFDASAPRSDIYTTWAEDLLARDGLPIARFPLGDRSTETSPEGPALYGDAEGNVFRLSDTGVERFEKDAWKLTAAAAPEVKERLAAQQRTRAWPDQARRWAEQRRAPLPVNPVVTPR